MIKMVVIGFGPTQSVFLKFSILVLHSKTVRLKLLDGMYLMKTLNLELFKKKNAKCRNSGKLNGIYTKVNQVIYSSSPTSRKHLRTKLSPDLHLTYSKNGGNLGSE